MMEIFYETDKKWGNGILLNEYEGRWQLVRAYKSRNAEDTIYMKWGFPQTKDKEPTAKAIPWSLDLGDARQAQQALRYFLEQLGGEMGDPGQTEGEDIPF